MGQERLGPSYFFISLALGPLNSLLWYVPSLGIYGAWLLFFVSARTNKRHHHLLGPLNREREREFWLGTEAGRLGCYDFSGETWGGDGSAYKGEMGAGSVCLHRQDKCLVVRVGREEEGANTLRPELAAVARTLQATPLEIDLLYWNKEFLRTTYSTCARGTSR